MTLGHSWDDARAWQAVLRRDARADGRVYYAVGTTGVYCRPSCASRQAKVWWLCTSSSSVPPRIDTTLRATHSRPAYAYSPASDISAQ